ncbi:MAG TPA: 7-carboxy-7-deazaguanine synthase QueE [Bryobacteraceae bacterium]|nr:7-carboxy-7-deazaguanine synthase QueE [Bryobacteraceae bacterium]
MKIAEVFYSIQGEGVLCGVPSVFLRTSGCNLRCEWCDTPYTSWKPEGEEWSIGRMADYVRLHSTGHVVVTGGEPMIQPQIGELTRAMRAMRQHITIETAGTVFQQVECDLMSISPKLQNSTPWNVEDGKWAAQHDRLRYQPEVLQKLMAGHDYQLKFVVRQPDDLEEVGRVVAEVKAERGKVLLMPEGITAGQLAARGEWIVEACKTYGYRYTPRLHVELWGNRRAV